MSKRILITGGAGFIGSHLANELVHHGHDVRILDNLAEQVHGETAHETHSLPDYLNNNVTAIVGDICDPKAVEYACTDVDVIYHFAARVGVGQSMYEAKEYTEVNNVGTAILMEELSKRPVERLIVASSMSIYGEGLFQRTDGELVAGVERELEQLKRGEWELRDEHGNELAPVPTQETKTPSLASVYALSKYDQERMCLLLGRAYNIPTVALRFFNVYGPHQALANPYTGVIAIFASRLLNNNRPLIYEDGYQQRDFVHVEDVARACRLAMEVDDAAYQTFNIGSGNQYTVREIAEQLAKALHREELEPEITGKYRVGDIRHCFADITRAQNILGFTPQVSLDDGMVQMAEWLNGQVAEDRVADANSELTMRGLTI